MRELSSLARRTSNREGSAAKVLVLVTLTTAHLTVPFALASRVSRILCGSFSEL